MMEALETETTRRIEGHAGLLNNFGNYLHCQYEPLQRLGLATPRAGDVLGVPTSTQDYRYSRRAGRLFKLVYLHGQYVRIGDLEDTEYAIVQSKAALEATPEGHPDRASLLHNLGLNLHIRYSQTRNLQDLQGSIALSKAAAEATPEGHPNWAERWNSFGSFVCCGWGRTLDLPDLEHAIAQLVAVVEATPEDHPCWTGRLTHFGGLFQERYKQTGNLQDLEDASAHSVVVPEATPAAVDRPGRAAQLTLHAIGLYLYWQYEHTRDLQDLQAAIARFEACAAVEATPEDRPYRAQWLNNLIGQCLHTRYHRTGNLQDLDRAITLSGDAVEETLTPENHPDRVASLHNLGAYLGCRFERTRNPQDLDRAITQFEAAVERAPRGHSDRASSLANLRKCLHKRHERARNLQDLEAAMTESEATIEATIDATPEDHVHHGRALLLGNLGNGLQEETRHLQDLEHAITQFGAALEATPKDHPGWTALLNTLGLLLHQRYKRTGNLQDLEDAITQLGAALKATPEDHSGWTARLLSNHGLLLYQRYKRTGNLQDLEHAITQFGAALEATPKYHRGWTALLNTLGLLLHQRYKRTGNLQDLDLAIAKFEKAAERLQEAYCGQLPLFTTSGTLGNCLYSRYEETGNLQDLEAALTYSRAAVAKIPEGHPERGHWLHLLGHHEYSRYQHTKNPWDLEAAIAAWFATWNITNAPNWERLQAAKHTAMTFISYIRVKDLSRASSLLYDAAHLIPMSTFRSLQREDQQHILGRLNGLASITTAVFLEAGQSLLEVLRLQELGRSIANSQLLDYRSDIPDLVKQHPRLAADFDAFRQELDTPPPSIECSNMSIKQCLQVHQATECTRNRVVRDFNNILLQIRQQPGFEDFLGMSDADLLSAAREGPIVVLNATEIRSDAILITKAHVTSITLPDLSHASMMKYLGTTETWDNEVKRELLGWLWKAAVLPVLRKLGFYPRPNAMDPLPRIWWIGVGLMAKAPIHAATKFRKRQIDKTTFQFCRPSYTSTIRALEYPRAQQLSKQNSSTLIVTMPTTPGESSLSDATKEANKIEYHLGDSSTVNTSTVDTLERPTAKRVLEALPGYSIVHFACHGISSSNPANSHLLLLKESISDDGSCIEEVDQLCVNDIAALKLPTARLAYLSACSTADSASSELVDEVAHIVSSFHIAGFSSVIGSLWPPEDEACQKMAAEFYSMLSKTDDVAASYHHAVLELMKQKPSQPMYWAPFIHFGE